MYDWKVRARKRAAMAVLRGKIDKKTECERCNEGPTQMHHDDYRKPLEVEWLCRRCHKVADAEITETGPVDETLVYVW